MASVLITALKFIGAAILIALLVLAIKGELDDLIAYGINLFKTKIGEAMIVPLIQNPREVAMMLWG